MANQDTRQVANFQHVMFFCSRGQTFMATIEVPQKKNGDMSNRRAASCCIKEVSTSPPATGGSSALIDKRKYHKLSV